MPPVEVFAPANIALAKYWGKRNRALNLPTNSSLSISLGSLGTTTRIAEAEKDTLLFNGKPLDNAAPEAQKIWRFVALCCPHRQQSITITTSNSIPTAAGLASSASGFAALTLALNEFFNLQLSDNALSTLARQGSGSACRSLWHGFVEWQKGEREDGSDSYATPIASHWQALRIALIEIETQAKKTSSRDGMNHTATTSPLFAAWVAQAEKDVHSIKRSIAAEDFMALGQTAEANAMMMHATMLAARPPLSYFLPESLATLQRIWHCREQGLAIFATMDAGPNVKILYQVQDEAAVIAAFPHAHCINPFSRCS